MRTSTIFGLLAIIALCHAQISYNVLVQIAVFENGVQAHTINVTVDATGPVFGAVGVYTGSITGSIDNLPSVSVQAQVTVTNSTMNYFSNDANQLVVFNGVKAIVAADQNLASLLSAAQSLPIVQSAISQVGTGSLPINVTFSLDQIIQTGQELNLQSQVNGNGITAQTPTLNGTYATITVTFSATSSVSTTSSPSGANSSGDNNARNSGAEVKFGMSVAAIAGAAFLML
jgi:hypothetical protein